MLHSDDIERMLVEIMTGKKPTLNTPEANAVREKLVKECAEIVANGGTVDIPREIPELA